MTWNRVRPLGRTIALGSVVTLALAGCANSGDDTEAADTPSDSGTGGSQVVKSTDASGGNEAGCTLEEYGAKKIDLKDAVVGFSQSEPNTAAFRAAETESIKQAAEDVGV